MTSNTQEEEEVLDLLYSVIDPELDVNVVDLGLIYTINVTSQYIQITMTLSSKACPMGDLIMEEIRERILCSFPERKLILDLVWEPSWSTERITTDGLRKLNGEI